MGLELESEVPLTPEQTAVLLREQGDRTAPQHPTHRGPLTPTEQRREEVLRVLPPNHPWRRSVEPPSAEELRGLRDMGVTMAGAGVGLLTGGLAPAAGAAALGGISAAESLLKGGGAGETALSGVVGAVGGPLLSKTASGTRWITSALWQKVLASRTGRDVAKLLSDNVPPLRLGEMPSAIRRGAATAIEKVGYATHTLDFKGRLSAWYEEVLQGIKSQLGPETVHVFGDEAKTLLSLGAKGISVSGGTVTRGPLAGLSGETIRKGGQESIEILTKDLIDFLPKVRKQAPQMVSGLVDTVHESLEGVAQGLGPEYLRARRGYSIGSAWRDLTAASGLMENGTWNVADAQAAINEFAKSTIYKFSRGRGTEELARTIIPRPGPLVERSKIPLPFISAPGKSLGGVHAYGHVQTPTLYRNLPPVVPQELSRLLGIPPEAIAEALAALKGAGVATGASGVAEGVAR